MAETFFGPWSVRVLSKDASFSERFTILGSTASDGSFPGTPGTGVATVTGTQWTLTLEWNNNAGSGWQPSDVRRSAEYLLQDGLVVTLGADDNFPALRDHDFNDMIVTCTSLDPALNPLTPVSNPYNFTVPVIQPAPPPGPKPPPVVYDPPQPGPKPPPVVYDPPPVVYDPPPVVYEPPPVVYDTPPVVDDAPPVVVDPPTILDDPPPVDGEPPQRDL